jgi:hypothetical protein
MDLSKIMADFHQELDHLTQAINSLEHLAYSRKNDQVHLIAPTGVVRKRGRPLGSKNKYAAKSVRRASSTPPTLVYSP